MENVIIGKITGIRYDDTDNEIDKPVATFRTKQGRTHTMPLMSKGVWQFLRLEYGRKIDKDIKEYKSQSKDRKPLFVFASDKVRKNTPEGEWQILIKNGIIMTLASKQHLIYSEDKIYRMIQSKLKRLKLQTRQHMIGRIIHVKSVPGLKLGVHVFAGDIFTQHAIKFATFIEVKKCLNPLTFLNLKTILATRTNVARILRIHKQKQLKERLTVVLKKSLESVEESLSYVENSKKVKINDSHAIKLLVAMNSSFYIGTKVTEICYEQYIIEKRKHKSTLWALAMATSWTAQHGQCFDKHHQKTRNSLSTISGALLLISDLKKSIKGCDDYIKTNGDANKLYKEVLKTI